MGSREVEQRVYLVRVLPLPSSQDRFTALPSTILRLLLILL